MASKETLTIQLSISDSILKKLTDKFKEDVQTIVNGIKEDDPIDFDTVMYQIKVTGKDYADAVSCNMYKLGEPGPEDWEFYYELIIEAIANL